VNCLPSPIVPPIRTLAVAPTDNALLAREVAAGIGDANASSSPGLRRAGPRWRRSRRPRQSEGWLAGHRGRRTNARMGRLTPVPAACLLLSKQSIWLRSGFRVAAAALPLPGARPPVRVYRNRITLSPRGAPRILRLPVASGRSSSALSAPVRHNLMRGENFPESPYGAGHWPAAASGCPCAACACHFFMSSIICFFISAGVGLAMCVATYHE
jgi:hypothetical protein